MKTISLYTINAIIFSLSVCGLKALIGGHTIALEDFVAYFLGGYIFYFIIRRYTVKKENT